MSETNVKRSSQSQNVVGIEVRRASHRRIRGFATDFSNGPQSPSSLARTFPQASLRSRTAGFPRSGSDLGFPLQAFPVIAKLKRWHTYAPHMLVYLQARSCFEGQLFSALSPRTTLEPPSAQSPFASCRCYRHKEDISRLLEARYRFFVAHKDSCAKPLSSFRLWLSLVRKVFAGCCQPLLHKGPSRRYLCRSFSTCLGPYSGCSQGALSRFFPQDFGLPLRLTGSALRNPPTATSVGLRISELQSFSNVQTRRFARHTDSSYPYTSVSGSRGFYIRAYHGSLPLHAADMLTAQNRAIGGRGTFTLQDRQPCRLLPIGYVACSPNW